jgi:hypothetical protein
MRITARGGTGGASIVLFWPDNLPEDADTLLRRDPIDLVERLRGEGRLIRLPCDADGEYTVSIHLRAPVPEPLLALCRDEERYPKLIVSGDGYFGGVEYLFKYDRRLLDKYPHMCEKVAIPDGTYTAWVYQTDVPELMYDGRLLEQAGARAVRLWNLHGRLAALSVVAVLGTLLTYFVLPWLVWLGILTLTLAACGSAIALSKTGSYKAVAKAQADFENAYPAYVVHLE